MINDTFDTDRVKKSDYVIPGLKGKFKQVPREMFDLSETNGLEPLTIYESSHLLLESDYDCLSKRDLIELMKRIKRLGFAPKLTLDLAREVKKRVHEDNPDFEKFLGSLPSEGFFPYDEIYLKSLKRLYRIREGGK